MRRLCRLGRTRLDRARRQQAPQQAAQQARLLLHDRHRLQVLDYPRDNFHAQFLVGILTPAVLEGNLDLVAFGEKFANMAQLGLQVVLIHAGVELDFLDLLPDLGLARLLPLDALLIAELAEVHDFADWWICIGGDLDQVEPLCICGALCITRRHDAKHAAIRAEDADGRYTNLEVDTNERSDG